MGEVIAAGLLTLGGVVVGAFLNVFVDRSRWRRDWLVSQVNKRVEHHADLLEALYAQHVLVVMAAAGAPVRDEAVAAAAMNWRRQLARGLTAAPAGVQHAVRRYDEAQGAAVTAINAGNAKDDVAGRLAELEAARLEVLAEVQKDQNDINGALGRHLLSTWQKLRGAEPWKELGQAPLDAEPPPDQ
jgi:hypothetical protein